MDSKSAVGRRERIAIGLAAFFHLVGLAGLLFFPEVHFAALTPFNFLVVLVLLFWSRENMDSAFLTFSVAVWFLGFVAEVVGVNTGYLFGDYQYGTALGPKVLGVPLLIGVNWLLVILGSRAWATMAVARLEETGHLPVRLSRPLAEVFAGAAIATAFDWIIEPVAVRLGYWSWTDGEIPLWNYACWFLVSVLMLLIGRFRPFNTRDPYAAYLLVIQLLFFVVLRLLWGVN